MTQNGANTQPGRGGLPRQEAKSEKRGTAVRTGGYCKNFRQPYQAKQWGEDYIYTKWAREAKERKLSDYDAGKIIEVEREEYHDCGMDYCDCFMSDGSVSTLNFGYSD